MFRNILATAGLLIMLTGCTTNELWEAIPYAFDTDTKAVNQALCAYSVEADRPGDTYTVKQCIQEDDYRVYSYASNSTGVNLRLVYHIPSDSVTDVTIMEPYDPLFMVNYERYEE